ncbi:hypothetical protein [Streptomyces sp. NPDC055036]
MTTSVGISNINLWTGLGMLALGLFFLVWLKLRPTAPPTPTTPTTPATSATPPAPPAPPAE